MKRKGLKLISELGHGKKALRLYDHFFNFPSDLNFSVDSKIKQYELDKKEGEILFPLVRGQWRTPIYYQCILSHAFRTRGYDSLMLLCHNDVPMCHRRSPNDESDYICDLCNFYGNKFLDKFGITPMPLSDIEISNRNFSPDHIDEEIEYQGIQISKYAKASVRKFLRRYSLNFNDQYCKNVYERALNSAAKHVDICKDLINQRDLSAVLGFDPTYNISGIYLTVAKKHGLPTYSISSGYRDGYIMFGRQEKNKLPHPQFTSPEIIKNHIKTPLNRKELKKIDAIMKKRKSGKPSTVPYTQKGTSLESSEDNTTVGMFTNLLWDGSLEIETAPFPDVFDWIYQTIDYFMNSDEVLIIRTHPVEAVRKTNEKVATAVRKKYEELPKNIILIEPEDQINTYQLMNDLDVGIVYNSTVGLEMAYNDLPVIVGGDTHYRNLGFTYDPSTPEEYNKLLNNLSGLRSKKNTKKRARRYAYFLFVQKHIQFPHYAIEESDSAQLGPVSHEDIKPGNRNFDFIVHQILNNKTVIRN